jgi:hypothetical protein
VDTNTHVPYRSEQVGELRIDVAVRPETLDIRPLDDEDDVGFVSILVEGFEASKMAAAPLGLPVGKLGDTVLDVRTGLDFHVRGLLVRRRQQEVRSSVIRKLWFAFDEVVSQECRKRVAG